VGVGLGSSPQAASSGMAVTSTNGTNKRRQFMDTSYLDIYRSGIPFSQSIRTLSIRRNPMPRKNASKMR
jgi:hypothetical protein